MDAERGGGVEPGYLPIQMRCDRCQLRGMCRKLRAATKERFRWSLHNLFGHPLSELAWLVGLRKLSDWLHDASIPRHAPGEGRG
jgi:hypothetical protein